MDLRVRGYLVAEPHSFLVPSEQHDPLAPFSAFAIFAFLAGFESPQDFDPAALSEQQDLAATFFTGAGVSHLSHDLPSANAALQQSLTTFCSL